MKIPGYITYQSNITKELNDGSPILIKFHINYRLDDDYLTDILDIEVKTSLGKINITTIHLSLKKILYTIPRLS